MTTSPVKVRYTVADNAAAAGVFGHRDANLRVLEAELGVQIVARGNEMTILGAPKAVERAVTVLDDLVETTAHRGVEVTDVRQAVELARTGTGRLQDLDHDVLCVTPRGRPVAARTQGQKAYVAAMRRHAIVFGIGPAGTGKTYLAVARAIAALKAKEVARLVLTRPAVEAGEKLGFLPGDLQEKVDPYFRPLYDALYDILGIEGFQRAMERGVIEIAPLAYMRGRTLDHAFIILDEAQNTTPEQMKMFLTRLGAGSRAVITGDLTQIDLPEGKFSGLQQVQGILRGVEGIAFVHLRDGDVVRHELVRRIIRAYERHERSADRTAQSGENGPEGGHEAPLSAPIASA